MINIEPKKIHHAAVAIKPLRRAAQWALVCCIIEQAIQLATTYIGLLKTTDWESSSSRETLWDARRYLAWILIPELNVCGS